VVITRREATTLFALAWCLLVSVINYSGKVDKIRRAYPVIVLRSTDPMSTRGGEFIGVIIAPDSRVPTEFGRLLKFTDADGYEFVFRRCELNARQKG
jgi:hypothetical protein